MSLAGKLTFSVGWDGYRVTSVEVRSSRPQAACLLEGKTVEEAMRLVPLLFGICGKAQTVAARSAAQAAQNLCGDKQLMLRQRRLVALEAAQEHLWRLLVDWPNRLGLPAKQGLMMEWVKRISISRGDDDVLALGEAMLTMIEQDVLDESLDCWAATLERAERTPMRGLAGASLEMLRGLEPLHSGHPVFGHFLPRQAACLWGNELQPYLDGHFAVRPLWRNAPAEAGALALHHQIPLLAELLRTGHAASARYLARLVDWVSCVRLLRGEASSTELRLDACKLGKNAGLACVDTARGLLLHYIEVALGQIVRYVIVAPTEWNFHPAGPFVQTLRSLRADDAASLYQRINILILAFDPCVEYEVNLHHA
ncbi:hydrogenase expression/formation protein HupK [Sulfuriferula plumbiphila]|uniref:Hydrogenase expression/formation protein HupK n=1 Tax=Sulfuriferula plumbiphila TaxID=171865 RepID=A0A512LBG3_9PROT|nr:nickel-dependent hydrogenase large subunit [Sulfuriferula plumbiphila]BBP04470.1 hydrogenase expression/formation protein HupK [Sulfuriferula plumbiphila]GEP31772.1 hydrogenase expression/formation protein HupK [Sulfuriferula plumbiphila]